MHPTDNNPEFWRKNIPLPEIDWPHVREWRVPFKIRYSNAWEWYAERVMLIGFFQQTYDERPTFLLFCRGRSLIVSISIIANTPMMQKIISNDVCVGYKTEAYPDDFLEFLKDSNNPEHFPLHINKHFAAPIIEAYFKK